LKPPTGGMTTGGTFVPVVKVRLNWGKSWPISTWKLEVIQEMMASTPEETLKATLLSLGPEPLVMLVVISPAVIEMVVF